MNEQTNKQINKFDAAHINEINQAENTIINVTDDDDDDDEGESITNKLNSTWT